MRRRRILLFRVLEKFLHLILFRNEEKRRSLTNVARLGSIYLLEQIFSRVTDFFA